MHYVGKVRIRGKSSPRSAEYRDPLYNPSSEGGYCQMCHVGQGSEYHVTEHVTEHV